MTTDKKLVDNFLRILWVPKLKDRVIVRVGNRYVRGSVEGEHEGLYLTSAERGAFKKSVEMRFVPRGTNYTDLVKSWDADGHIIIRDSVNGVWNVCRRYKDSSGRDRYTFAEGSLHNVIARLLDSRAVDPEWNIIINRMVQRNRSAGIRLGEPFEQSDSKANRISS